MAIELSARAFAALQTYRLLHGFVSMSAAASVPFLGKFSRRINIGFKDYLGFVTPAQKPVLWVHGVSMGESMVAAGFAAELKRRFPGFQIAFTTTHPDVYAGIVKRQQADIVAYFPLDNPVFMNRVFNRWKPSAVFVAETDFWPEFSWQCQKRNIPLLLINGRISEKIARFYRSFNGLGEVVFGAFALLAVQTTTDASRLLEIGARPDQIKILGNMKADLTPSSDVDLSAIKRWVNQRPCVVLGSLHPSEFKILQPAFRQFSENRVALIIAPRNPANGQKWQQELQNSGLNTCLRSALNTDCSSEVMILDTMGELASVYRLADAALVGGSIDQSVGGHNPLEVIQQHVPLLMGPNCRNFADIVSQLQSENGIGIVETAETFLNAVNRLLNDRNAAEEQVLAADGVLEESRGCLEKTFAAAVTAARLK
ncbi:MAG: glycosyltransferase N-terminal domain-containing protein [Candidatus Riflebacteria bacterium]|nr:glycosyltransferase N-terminal domain-containing protein [Candidatus Riflebacteria bacterium]